MSAVAIIDRLVHHAEILSLKGDSYAWSEMEPQYALGRAHWDLCREVDLLRAAVERLRAQQEIDGAPRQWLERMRSWVHGYSTR
jgi:hypothetical protein